MVVFEIFYTIMITSSFFGTKGNHYKRNIVIFSINSLLFFMSLSPCVRHTQVRVYIGLCYKYERHSARLHYL